MRFQCFRGHCSIIVPLIIGAYLGKAVLRGRWGNALWGATRHQLSQSTTYTEMRNLLFAVLRCLIH